jgi:hypothetical protein
MKQRFEISYFEHGFRNLFNDDELIKNLTAAKKRAKEYFKQGCTGIIIDITKLNEKGDTDVENTKHIVYGGTEFIEI